MKRLFFIVHNFRHARAVLASALENGFFPVLITARQVVVCLGAPAAVAMIDEAARETGNDSFDAVFDAANNVGAAMALLRRPDTTVFIDADGDVLKKLNALAEKTRSKVLRCLPTDALDMAKHFHLESACRDYAAQTEGKK